MIFKSLLQLLNKIVYFTIGTIRISTGVGMVQIKIYNYIMKKAKQGIGWNKPHKSQILT